ncbi:MAG: class I SAM-dependent methyltransferase [Selenomonas sp.]|uniref:class I SAM-dependent methyltransferase n=1 Tax=Selenomonas sp. TaxID=2053611 RepID=UPI0025DBF0CA|nr:class I SAM-dependent methyltransferase [Selenomonas sp.]MCR5439587.1 class I SAM-dependent methyltransferase [Selenomonas sp.]
MNLSTFYKQIMDSGILCPLQDKRVLIIGDGHQVCMPDGMNLVTEEIHMGQYVLANGGVPDIYELSTVVNESRFAPIPTMLTGKYQGIIVVSGLEKEENPVVSLQMLLDILDAGGFLFCVTRTPKFNYIRNSLSEYEDLWRFTAEEFKQILGEESIKVFIEEPAGHYMAIMAEHIVGCSAVDCPLFSYRTETRLSVDDLRTKGFFADCRELDKIGSTFNTDKNRFYHNYLPKYEFFLAPFRHKNFNLLELGIFKGGSAKMWEKYFPNAQIHCVDIDENCKSVADDRIIVHIRDLGIKENVEQLRSIKPSVIVDDASHMWSHQLLALFTLYECLPSGGVYILEDLETSLNERLYPGMDGGCRHNVYDVLSRIAKVVGSKELETDVDELSATISNIGLKTEMFSLMKGSCVLIRK